MTLRTVPGMINVKTPIGSAVSEFNRMRAAQMPEVKEGWAMGATAKTSHEGNTPKSKVKFGTSKRVAYPECTQNEATVQHKTSRSNDRLPISGGYARKRPSSNNNCPCTKPKESYGPRAEIRGQNPNSIYSGNAPHIVEGWRAKNTRKTVKAIVIVLIVVVVIMLIACMLMKMMKPKNPVIFSRYVDLDALASSPSSSTAIKYPEVPMVDDVLLFGGKKAKKCSCGKCPDCLKQKAKKCSCGKCPSCLKQKAKKSKKAIRKLNEVYSADDEELI